MRYIFIIRGLTGYLKLVAIKCSVCAYKCMIVGLHGWIQKGEKGVQTPSPPEKSQMAIGFLRKTGTDPLEKQLDPRCVQLLLQGGSYVPL